MSLWENKLGNPDYQYIQAPYSKISLDILKANIVQIKNLFEARSSDARNNIGFDDYLKALDRNALSEEIVSELNAVIGSFDGLPADLRMAIEQNPQELEDLYQKMHALVVHFKTDMTSAFSVLITYQDKRRRLMKNLGGRLNQEISIAPLIIFRIIFGALACYGAIRFLTNDWIQPLYQEPIFYFTYYGFNWVKPLPGAWMYLPFIAMIISSLGIVLGLFYRWSTTLYFLAFTYVELLDKTNYLNHYYLFSLLAFLMIFLPAHRRFSIDVKRGAVEPINKIPFWLVFLLQFQLACVYFFAGIAKINSDWLMRAEPMSTWLQSHRDMPIFGNLLAEKWIAITFSWIGCIYDITIVFLLWMSKTRRIAYVFVVAFHLVTYILFPIGIFPL